VSVVVDVLGGDVQDAVVPREVYLRAVEAQEFDRERVVRQLGYTIVASLDETGQRAAAGYRTAFGRVADRAGGNAVYEVACQLSATVADGERPSPRAANAVAERVLDDWAYTDGGE